MYQNSNMKYILAFFFYDCFVFYTHIYYNLKTSSDLEVFEVDNLSKDKLEEICNYRQPVMITIMLKIL